MYDTYKELRDAVIEEANRLKENDSKIDADYVVKKFGISKFLAERILENNRLL